MNKTYKKHFPGLCFIEARWSATQRLRAQPSSFLCDKCLWLCSQALGCASSRQDEAQPRKNDVLCSLVNSSYIVSIRVHFTLMKFIKNIKHHFPGLCFIEARWSATQRFRAQPSSFLCDKGLWLCSQALDCASSRREEAQPRKNDVLCSFLNSSYIVSIRVHFTLMKWTENIKHHFPGLCFFEARWSATQRFRAQPSSFLCDKCLWLCSQALGCASSRRDEAQPRKNDVLCSLVEGSLEVKLPTIWTVEKQGWEESEEKRSEERISEEKESEERRCRCAKR